MVLVNSTMFIVLFCAFRKVDGEISQFRILAPEIVCPKDENAVIEKPDHIAITLQTESNLKFEWAVRWAPLDAPTQRFTLQLWRTVRALEAQLNGPQPDPFAFVINNTQLLGGVDYIFNITSTSVSENSKGTTKSFHIDNIKGDEKLIVDGRSDKFSVFLVGGGKIFTDMEYILVAEVTTCSPTQDYYFSWNVEASGNIINVADISGRRLEIPPYTLRAGVFYHVTCQVFRNTSLVTQTELPFEILHRGLTINLNVDVLLVTIEAAFTVEAIVENHDYYDDIPTFEWSCTYQGEPCENFETSETETLLFSKGLPHVGQYDITILVNVLDQKASTNATVIVVEPILPVIQIEPLSRLLNEKSTISLVANASNVTPSCTLSWYFATQHHLVSCNEVDERDECKHGEALSDSLTILSLEENFLHEITDFTNETEWRQITADLEAAEGRARFVAECGCSLTFSCKTEGMAYADISFKLNPAPIVADLKISPELGTAMETVFRISRLSASDPDKPLLYTLLCSIGNSETLVLGSNLEHLTVDTFLPYIGGRGTEIWAEVCDSLGACAKSNVTVVPLSAGEARSKELLVDEMRGYVLRCEMMLLNQVVRSTFITYLNSGQDEALAAFTKDVLETLPAGDLCLKEQQEYWTMLHWLASRGVDTSVLE